MRNYETDLSEHVYRYGKMIGLGLSTLEKSLFFSTHLKKSLQPVPQEVEVAYEQYKSLIIDIYGEDHLKNNYVYHGSGRYHYQPEGSHKYASHTNGTVVDILKTVLDSGLQPQKDIWVPTPASNPTVSLTHQRFYSRWYADKHNYDELLWSYGSSLDWASMFTVKNISHVLEIPYILSLISTQSKLKSGGLLGSVHRWVSDVRNDITARTSYADSLKTKSTIPNNFGIVFVIQESDILSYDFPLLRRSETRTLAPIPPSAFVAIEVPLKHVHDVTSLLAEACYSNVHVLPTECVDVHMSRFPFEELTKMDGDNRIEKPDIKVMDMTELDFSPITYDSLRRSATESDAHPYSARELLSVLDESSILHALLSQKSSWEGFSIRYHTLSGLLLFEKYFSHSDKLPKAVKEDFFRIFFSLHDIGDSLGKTTKSKLAYNQAICVAFLTQLGFDTEEIVIANALLSDDPIGSYLKKVGSIVEMLTHAPESIQSALNNILQNKFAYLVSDTVTRIRRMADMANMDYSDFLQLITLFHMIDAGAYTTTGGTVGSLNYVFTFDDIKGKMSYSPNIQPLIAALQQ